jgi:hypothetical protein
MPLATSSKLMAPVLLPNAGHFVPEAGADLAKAAVNHFCF